tara:strand:- start:5102 stop:5950 length:849 start_codon:yes stop_codon:yes gene_type:complete
MAPFICYKYRPIGNVKLKSRAADIIERNQLYYAAPTQFNDPYDCIPPVKLPDSDADLERLFKPTFEAIKEKHGIGHDIDFAQLIPEMRKDSYLISESTMENGIAVLCMSLTANNPQQWAYYGDMYAGICIGIDMSFLPDEEHVEVTYQDERVTVDLSSVVAAEMKAKKDFLRAIATKHSGWQHEKEVRFFKTQQDPYPFPPKALKEVIFGHRCDDHAIDFIEMACSRSDADPTFGYVLPNEKTFALDVRKGLTIGQVKDGLAESRSRKKDVVSAIPSHGGRR